MLIPIPCIDSNYRTEKYRLPKCNTAQHYVTIYVEILATCVFRNQAIEQDFQV